MKHIFLLSLLLSQINFIYGQKKHELKIDFLSARSNNYIPHYEAVLTNRIGVEIALGFDFRDIYLQDIDFNPFTLELHEFSSFHFNPSLGAKYYLLSLENGSGIFAGPYTQINFLLWREEGYVEKWEEIENRKAPEKVFSNRGIRSLRYGLHYGGKLIIKDHYIIELVGTYALFQEIGKGANENTIYNIQYYAKLGYRF